KKENDKASQDRLGALEEELGELEVKSGEITRQWEAEKSKLSGAQKIKEELEAARLELEQAQRGGDLAKAGELAYGVVPELEKKLKAAEESGEEYAPGHLVRETVTDEDIGLVVSRWTGIPVDKLLEGERDKLLR